jgi:dihydroxyacetone kinase-like protein
MATKIYDCIEKIGEKIIENKDFLTDLDREIGDADHGVNMARGFHAVAEKLPQDEADIGAALKKTGMTLLSTVGGASGPLYGTAYMEAGKKAAGKTEVTGEDIKAMLEAAIAGIQKRGKAVKGEKTMLDALFPAVRAMQEKLEEGLSLPEIFLAGATAAENGVEFTKTISANKGRAAYIGQRSIGHQDPGATTVMLMLQALHKTAIEMNVE